MIHMGLLVVQSGESQKKTGSWLKIRFVQRDYNSTIKLLPWMVSNFSYRASQWFKLTPGDQSRTRRTTTMSLPVVVQQFFQFFNFSNFSNILRCFPRDIKVHEGDNIRHTSLCRYGTNNNRNQDTQ